MNRLRSICCAKARAKAGAHERAQLRAQLIGVAKLPKAAMLRPGHHRGGSA
jgi:hypothetical protein